MLKSADLKPNSRIEAPLEKLRRLRELQRQVDESYLTAAGTWEPYPWQVPPDEIPTAGAWLMLGGRGTGKTDGAAHYLIEHVNGPPCDTRLPGGHRFAIVAPTLGDASDACVNGPSGLRAYAPGIREVTRKGGTYVIFPNGAEGKLFGAHSPDDIERLRAGGNRCFGWWEELAAWARLDEGIKHARYGLRLGAHAHVVASTTPKPRDELKALIEHPRTRITHGKTSEAIHLDATVRAQLYEDYAGTRLGRQELEGELLSDVPGALWTVLRIDELRARAIPDSDPIRYEVPDFVRVVTAIDPAGGTEDHNDETGIVVAARSADGEFYVLADRSCRDSPNGWASRALLAHSEFGGDRIVGESNYGGDMVESTIRSIEPTAPFSKVTASRGKRQRAEPIAALYEQGRVHHVGSFPKLEDQMTQWVPESGKSPDRMDALVWALTELLNNPPRKGARMTHVSRR